MKVTSRLSIIYREDRTRYSMQFLADIMKKLSEDGKITREDLYNLKESDVIEIIENPKGFPYYKIIKLGKPLGVWYRYRREYEIVRIEDIHPKGNV